MHLPLRKQRRQLLSRPRRPAKHTKLSHLVEHVAAPSDKLTALLAFSRLLVLPPRASHSYGTYKPPGRHPSKLRREAHIVTGPGSWPLRFDCWFRSNPACPFLVLGVAICLSIIIGNFSTPSTHITEILTIDRDSDNDRGIGKALTVLCYKGRFLITFSYAHRRPATLP